MFIPNDGNTRCDWCLKDELYVNYHDHEWGKPVYDDKLLFEFLILESFQAGLSWHIVLKKRENFRKAFSDFQVEKVAAFSAKEVEALLLNPGIIRNRLKIEAAIHNASCFISVQNKYGSFSNYVWQFTDGKTLINFPKTIKDIPATSPQSDAMSKDMCQHGFKFRGSTICYAFMQAVGIVDDHLVSCWQKKTI